MANEERVTYEASLAEPAAGKRPRLYVCVRRFRGDEELTGRYEVFEDLARLDELIAHAAAAGDDVTALRSARERFAESLRKAT